MGYADDLLLIAPSRSAMETMLRICENYAELNNLEFSTDPDPAKSKSKCIFMCGHLGKAKPVNLQLYGVDLPWVNTAAHLGNELSWECNMDQDMKCKRGSFISRSTEVRETFGFAQPNQVLQAVKTYCFDMYGAMIWSLFSVKAQQVFNTWSTCVKLAWGVPRATHTYLVDNLLCAGIPSVRASVLARYLKFFESVKSSSSVEVSVVANLASADIRSVTGSNLFNLKKEAGMDITRETMNKARVVLLSARTAVPVQDGWRIGCLKKFLSERSKLDEKLQSTDVMDSLIDSLCST